MNISLRATDGALQPDLLALFDTFVIAAYGVCAGGAEKPLFRVPLYSLPLTGGPMGSPLSELGSLGGKNFHCSCVPIFRLETQGGKRFYDDGCANPKYREPWFAESPFRLYVVSDESPRPLWEWAFDGETIQEPAVFA